MSAERSREADGGTTDDEEISGARKTPFDPLTGTRVGDRYKILRVHDRGGMSVVYAAMYEAQQREVAIKVLDEASMSDPQAIERFMHEARTASSLSHGHVVGVSDFGRLPNGRPYLVMPMIPGKDLATLIAEEGPMPPARAAALLAGVASALDAMHAQGLIHRDIKSENLMYVRGDDGTETVLVLDFGIAAAPQSKELEDDATSGTPDFMAPEALAGEPIDHRADVYSLATVAFELLSGSLPFESTDVAQLAKLKTTQRPRTLWQASHQRFSPAIETVMARGLARDPKNRPSSAGKFVHALSVAASSASTTLQAPWVKALAAHAAAATATASAAKTVAADAQAEAAKAKSRAPTVKSGNKQQARKRTLVGQPFTPQVGEIEPVRVEAREPEVRVEVEEPAITAAAAAEPSIVVDPALFVEHAQRVQPPKVLPLPLQPIDSMSPAELDVEEATFKRPAIGKWVGGGLLAVAGIVAVVVVMSGRGERTSATTSASASATTTTSATTSPSASTTTSTRVEAAPSAVPVEAVVAAPQAQPEPVVPVAEPVVEAPAPVARKSSARTRERKAERVSVERAPAAPKASAQELTQAGVDAMLRGDFDSALAQLKAATADNPRYAPAHRSKGLVLERMGRSRDAATAFKQYLKLAPNAPDAAKIKARLAALD